MKTLTRKFMATTLAALQAIYVPVASATDLTDIPLAVKNTIAPNVMFTLDDSGSMKFEVIPESNKVYQTFPSGSTLYRTSYYNYGTYDQTPKFALDNSYARCFRNAQCNKLYYDPTKLYRPWSNSDNSLMSNMTPSSACYNPYRCSGSSSEGTLNLTTNQTWTRNWVANDGNDSSDSLTFYPATFFKYTGTGTAPTSVGDANNLASNYARVEIKSANAPFSITNGAARTDCTVTGTTASCTYDQEIQNFANWFSYYRSRILTARAGAGRAFAKQGNSLRIGFAAINKSSTSIDGTNTNTIVKGVRSFTGTDRSNWFAEIYDHAMPNAGTPLRLAVNSVGQYFKRTDNAGPWGQTPGSSTGTQYACRQNYNILMTDGYWTEGDDYDAATSGARANVDNTNGSTQTRANGTTYQYTARNPYSDSYSNTLADVAMYYWVNDLRGDDTSMPDKIVPANKKDPAFWQHLVNFTVGLGVYGTIPKATIDSAFAGINSVPMSPEPTTNPATTTPATPTITWPDPFSGSAEKVDDLAHAALNSRGNFFSASDPDSFATALTDALDDIVERTGAAAAVAVANANVTSGDNASYASSYNSGNWSGDLNAYPIDLTTGIPSTTSSWSSGSAGTQLSTRTSAVTDRYIVTYSGSGYSGSGLQFQPASATTDGNIVTKLSTTLNDRFNTPSATDSTSVINYLRGDRSGETAGTYRSRPSFLLGDIVNAEPLVIRNPSRRYIDSGYATFKANNATRTKVVVQPANDGMVHVFNASTGVENWAYVPNILINTNHPSSTTSSALNLLSSKTYSHRMYVDATPTLSDVNFSNTCGMAGACGATGTLPTADWRSLVVGGLGHGGRGVYALDMTTPTASSESNATSKVLWEFPNSSTDATVKAKVGYVYGRPIITKTAAKGWVVLVAAGYNNGTNSTSPLLTDQSGGDGHGYVFVLNARTGELITTLDTTIGSASAPSGLAHIAGFYENSDINNQALQVYGGDLNGNVWRFDLSDANSSNWSVKRLAILKDASGSSAATQPITTEPRFAQMNLNGYLKRMVYVGTGRYVGEADVTTTQTQTVYGLVDDMTSPSGTTPVISDNLRSSLTQQTFSAATTVTRTASNNATDWGTKKGWYIDLPSSTTPSERVVTNPSLIGGALIFTSNKPSDDPCIPGGSSWFNVLDYKTGGALQNSTLAWSSYSMGNVLGSRPIMIGLNGSIKALIRKSDGSTDVKDTGIPSAAPTKGRAGWREIQK